MNPGLFDNHVGQYAANQKILVSVSRDGDRLFIQPFGQARAELFAESNEQYFLRGADAQVTFQTDGNGFAQSVTLMQNDKIISAKRIR